MSLHVKWTFFLNPLSANVGYAPHEGEPFWLLVQAKLLKMPSVFSKEEKICYQMVCFILCSR